MDDRRSHQLQLYNPPPNPPPASTFSKYSKMVTMEFVINLGWGDRFARDLAWRVPPWDRRGPSLAEFAADGDRSYLHFPLISSVTVQGREGKG